LIEPRFTATSFTLASQKAPSVDIERFRSDLREADIEEMVDTLLGTFLEDSPERLTALEHAIEHGDAPAIESAAHAFKSGAGTIRATHLAELLRLAENGARNGQPDSSGLLEQVRVEYAAVRRQLEATLSGEG